jgi:hypothetical protein
MSSSFWLQRIAPKEDEMAGVVCCEIGKHTVDLGRGPCEVHSSLCDAYCLCDEAYLTNRYTRDALFSYHEDEPKRDLGERFR